MTTKWNQLTKAQQNAGRRLAERAWAVGVEVSVTRAATDRATVLAEVEAAEATKVAG